MNSEITKHLQTFCPLYPGSCYPSVLVRSLPHQSQVGLIYSVTLCPVGCARKCFVLGSAVKTKPGALSPLSLSVNINQRLPPHSPPNAPLPHLPIPLFLPHYCLQFAQQVNKYRNAHYKYPFSMYCFWHFRTHTLTHRSQDMRKWLGEALMGRPYVQALYVSRLTPSTLPDHHNLVCLQHKVWPKPGWVH